jgi:hypothetical protein
MTYGEPPVHEPRCTCMKCAREAPVSEHRLERHNLLLNLLRIHRVKVKSPCSAACPCHQEARWMRHLRGRVS